MDGDLETKRIVRRSIPISRWLNIGLGAWLIVSAWIPIWTLSDGARGNTLAVGFTIIAVATFAMFRPALRWVNTVLGFWLLFSSAGLFLDAAPAARWNNVVVGALVVLASIPREARSRDRANDGYVNRWARQRAR